MSTDAASNPLVMSRFEQLRFAREVVRTEGEALLQLASGLQNEVCDAVQRLFECEGNVIVTGMGKAGLVGQKIAATLASTGTNSHFLHPGEAIHGDLGRIHRKDIVLALSFSGETEEVVRLLPTLCEMQISVIAVTGNARSRLARASKITIDLGAVREACPLGLAPTTSTTAMLAIGDALALVLSRMHEFTHEDFARFHPGGSLGRKLCRVDEVMRPLDACRVAHDQETIREVLICTTKEGRRTGAVMLTGAEGKLSGIFTDSDLARLLETNDNAKLDQPIRETMNRNPTTVVSGSLLSDAVDMLAEHRFSELPVVDDLARPVGLVDITDIVSLWPIDTDPTLQGQSLDSPRDSVPKTVPFTNQNTG